MLCRSKYGADVVVFRFDGRIGELFIQGVLPSEPVDILSVEVKSVELLIHDTRA